jgi:DNA repair exonuclease SbcCD ATPase subunit
VALQARIRELEQERNRLLKYCPYEEENAALQAQLRAMVEDRDLWKEAHDDDCPNKNMLEATEAQLQAVTQERDTAQDAQDKWKDEYKCAEGRIAQLQARNLALEDALGKISRWGWSNAYAWVREIADAALAHPSQEVKP